MHLGISFFTDVARYHETMPCERHDRVYPTLEMAEEKARALLPDVRKRHGSTVGYAITDMGTNYTWAIGPGRHDHA